MNFSGVLMWQNPVRPPIRAMPRPRSINVEGLGGARDGMPRDAEEGDPTDSVTLAQLRSQTAAMAKQKASLHEERG